MQPSSDEWRESKQPATTASRSDRWAVRLFASPYAREGTALIAIDRIPEAAEEAAQVIRDEGHEAIGVVADVTQSDEVNRAVQAAIERFGRLDILHNNVGVVPAGGPLMLADPGNGTWTPFHIRHPDCVRIMQHAHAKQRTALLRCLRISANSSKQSAPFSLISIA
uniref:SDR family NAD(P)-dependent oxidoreductase n=1 Tax=Paraburkholderia hospita TaxID=169430 RepID=UPI003F504A8C